MKGWLSFLFFAFLAWFCYTKYVEFMAEKAATDAAATKAAALSGERPMVRNDPNLRPEEFQCDARRTCPEMRTCEEAKYFVRNCNTQWMDQNADGIPCETTLCASEVVPSEDE